MGQTKTWVTWNRLVFLESEAKSNKGSREHLGFHLATVREVLYSCAREEEKEEKNTAQNNYKKGLFGGKAMKCFDKFETILPTNLISFDQSGIKQGSLDSKEELKLAREDLKKKLNQEIVENVSTHECPPDFTC